MPTILVADDDEQVLDLLVEVLTEAGFTVVAASNGAKALERFTAQTIDVVVTDMQMPQLDGLGLLTAVKAQAPRVRVIVITGFSGLDDEHRTLADCGADLLLTKPLGRVSDLVVAVKATLAAPGSTEIGRLTSV